MFRIGYDAKRLFNNFTGLGNYSRTLLRNLALYYPDEDYFLYTPKVTRAEQTQYFLDSPMFNVKLPARQRRLLWRSWGIKQDLQRHKIGLYHGLSHEIPYGIRKTGIPTIVTIHDLVFKHYPGQYSWIDRQLYDLKFRYACKQSNLIVAISESTKQDIIHFYGIAPEKIKVIYQSCSEGFMVKKTPKARAQVVEKYALPAQFMLYVGSLIERKNLLGIVAAMRQLPPDERLPLVVVGQGEAYKARVVEQARKDGLLDLLVFIRPTFADLPALYQQAALFLYPSFCEGFGIPILEALFSETPVLTSNVSSLPEAAGPGSLLVDPADPAAIAAGIRAILGDEARRQQMIATGYAHAQAFRGEVLTEQMMAVYKLVKKGI
ncbi:MAG: glycosyltransferase family 1 protein [Bacteroidetes bacterium]|nr:MAG: glycosyltransferase family 1 protein [Bacteroidota bacterium]PTM12246.1 MAG: glycosyltransferase family 1 protein [Bacteroidota bacterium]